MHKNQTPCFFSFLKFAKIKSLFLSFLKFGDGLITFETREAGELRRLLGEQYKMDSQIAEIKPAKRLSGVVVNYDHVKLTGLVYCKERPTRNMFFHIDDCHIFGPRFMRFHQEVEFCTSYNKFIQIFQLLLLV